MGSEGGGKHGGMGEASGRRATWSAMALLGIGIVVLLLAPLGPATIVLIVVLGLSAGVVGGRSPALRNWLRLPGFSRPDRWSVGVAVVTGVVLGALVASSARGSSRGNVGAGLAAGGLVGKG